MADLALEMLCGRRLTAEEARAAGLAGRVFEGQHFDDQVAAAAGEMARQAGEPVRDIVALWRHRGSPSEHAAAERERFLARHRAGALR